MPLSCCGKLKLSFDAVFYYVTDMESSIAFYRNTLGLPLVSDERVAPLRSRWRAHRTRALAAGIGGSGK